MIFLIEYDRSKGELVTIQDFDDSQQQEADNTRLEIELELNRKGVQHEVVLLEAADRNALDKTHRRYFKNLREILENK